MGRYSPLSHNLSKLLNRIEPSRDGRMLYFPCEVRLKDGRILGTVYVEPEDMYIECWGIYPEDDKHKQSVRIDDVTDIQESPMRLPVRFANQIYEAGESGMGVYVFTALFADGAKQVYRSGSAIDFLPYPDGKGGKDIVEVMPHEGREEPSAKDCLPWCWCLYSGTET